jgi:hypothetical protein
MQEAVQWASYVLIVGGGKDVYGGEDRRAVDGDTQICLNSDGRRTVMLISHGGIGSKESDLHLV